MTIFFGGKVERPGPNVMELDSWLPFYVQGRESRSATDVILDFKENLDHAMSYAFQSLSTLDRGGSFIHDTYRDIFVRSLVDVLKLEAPQNPEFDQLTTPLSSSQSYKLSTPLRPESRGSSPFQVRRTQPENREPPRYSSERSPEASWEPTYKPKRHESVNGYRESGERSKGVLPKDHAKAPIRMFQERPLQSEFAKRYPHLFA